MKSKAKKIKKMQLNKSSYIRYDHSINLNDFFIVNENYFDEIQEWRAKFHQITNTSLHSIFIFIHFHFSSISHYCSNFHWNHQLQGSAGFIIRISDEVICYEFLFRFDWKIVMRLDSFQYFLGHSFDWGSFLSFLQIGRYPLQLLACFRILLD